MILGVGPDYETERRKNFLTILVPETWANKDLMFVPEICFLGHAEEVNIVLAKKELEGIEPRVFRFQDVCANNFSTTLASGLDKTKISG